MRGSGVTQRPASVLCALVLSLFWLAALAAADPACAQKVVNPDFALPPAAGTAQGIIVDPATSPQIGWTFTSTTVAAPTSSGVQQNGSAFGAPVAPNGEQQTAYINNLGTISQNIDFKEAGDYALSFHIAARAAGVPSGSAQSITVTIEGQQYGPYKPESSSSFNKITIPFSIKEPNPSVELKFSGCGLGSGCSVQTGEVTTDFIAEVEIAAVAPQITKGPADIDPTTKVELTGDHFGPAKGTVRIHFPSDSKVAFENKSPHGKSKSDLFLDVPGKWDNTITTEALDSASAVGAPAEQTVEITVIGANGATSNVWKAKFHDTPAITGVSPNSITPGQSFNVKGWDFGADAGTVTIHFPADIFHSPSLDSKGDKDAQIDKSKWTPSVVNATVPKNVTAVVEQDVDISLTPKGGKASNARKEKFNPTMVMVLVPGLVSQCANNTSLDLCNPAPGNYSGSGLDCLNPLGEPVPLVNSIQGFHMACFGFNSDSGQDVYAANVILPWWTITKVDYEEWPPLTPGVWGDAGSNGTMQFTLTPSVFPAPLIIVTINWHIGAEGGIVYYAFNMWAKGPAGVQAVP
jgi:hypothetical protein